MPRRSLFQIIFGNGKQDQSKYQSLQLLNGYQAVWTNPNNQLYDIAQVRACIDAIARNGAKVNPKHLRKYYDKDGKYRIDKIDGRIQTLISKKPNELMNAYDFYYKVFSELELNNNSFVYISRDSEGIPVGLYPIRSGSYTLLEKGGDIFIQFRFGTGMQHIASLKDDVIHLKKFYCDNDIIGGSNLPITKVMSIKHVINEGIVNAIKSTQAIKGIVKSTKAMLNPSDVAKMRNQFVKDFIDNADGSGIGGLDATTDFKEVNINPQTATDGQVGRVDDEVLNYFGINKDILQSSFDENKWNAFYESKLEPYFIEASLEFTNKLFSYGEKWHGNEIIFEANRLQYASNSTKINTVKTLMYYGCLTKNEAREIFNMSAIDGGDELAQSLATTDGKDILGVNKDE